MNQEDIIFIEKELNIKLTEAYIKAAIEAKMALVAQPTRFYDNPQKLVSMNNRLRKNGLHGQEWRDNHYAIGYFGDGAAYYFIDINVEDGCVYYADRTKTWKYSPDNISYNESPYTTIEKYVNNMYFLDAMVKNRAQQPQPPILTKEENQEKIANFLSDLRKSNKAKQENL